MARPKKVPAPKPEEDVVSEVAEVVEAEAPTVETIKIDEHTEIRRPIN